MNVGLRLPKRNVSCVADRFEQILASIGSVALLGRLPGKLGFDQPAQFEQYVIVALGEPQE